MEKVIIKDDDKEYLLIGKKISMVNNTANSKTIFGLNKL